MPRLALRCSKSPYLLHVGFATFLWSLVSVWLWFSHIVGLQVVGAIIGCAQLIHFPEETSCSAPSGMQGHSGATVAKDPNRVPILLQ